MADLFKTIHRYLASYLRAQGYAFVSTQYLEREGKVEFTFEKDERFDRIVQGYYNDKEAVLPQRFIQGLDEVREIIRDAKRGANQEEKPT